MTIMRSGTGFLLSVGTGLGVGLFAGSGWIWQGLCGAFLIAIANILLKSEHFQNYCANCQGKEVQLGSHFLQKFIIPTRGTTKPSMIIYLILSFIQNLVIIFVIAGIIKLAVRN